MRKKIIQHIIFFFLLLFSTSLYSQNKAVLENLENIGAKMGQDTAMVNMYISLGNKYANDQKSDSALLIVNKGLFLAKKLDYTYGIAELYALHGDIKVVQNELFEALGYYLNSVEYFDEGNFMRKLGDVLLVIGNIYITQANYPKALEYYQKGLVIADSLNLVKMIAYFYNNMGELYYNLGQFDNAINSYNRVMEIHRDKNDSIKQADVHSSLSTVYMKMDNIEKAREHLDQAFFIYEKSASNQDLLIAYKTKASLEMKNDNYARAISFYEKGLEHLQKIGTEYKGPKSIFEVSLYTGIGLCNMKLKNYSIAEENLLKGSEIAQKTGQLSLLKDITLYLSELYELKNNPIKAFDYYRYHKNYSDSLSQEENIKKITQLQMQFEFDQELKQRELEQARKDSIQKRKELIFFMISSSIFLAMLILFLLFRLQKNKVKRIRLERKNLKADLDYKNKELTTNVMYLLKKNEFIISISDKLKKTKYDFKPENRLIIDKIIRELEFSSKEINWKDFELRFQDVHTGFYKELNKQFPDLSPNELRLCAFLRLNMTTKEISAITFQSEQSISMARFRLRKKMEIDNYDNLIAFLTQL
jgi:tetratricopeptide (TPR) repeat protein